MATAVLKAKKPELIEAGKPKFLISGKSGVGKTMFSLSFPNVYYIDTEGGAVRAQYRKKLIESGGAYLGKDEGSQDFQVVIDQIRALATTKHEFKTLVIDSFSFLYNLAAAKAEERVGNDFGKDKREANRPTRQLMRWLEDLDMTAVLICHHKEKWERKAGELTHAGTTFDGFDKMEYALDLWIEAFREGSERFFIVKKSRIETLPEGDIHKLDFSKFSDLYGKDVIAGDSKPIELASAEQVQDLNILIKALNVSPETVEKWLEKESCESFADMKADRISTYIAAGQKQIAALTKGVK